MEHKRCPFNIAPNWHFDECALATPTDQHTERGHLVLSSRSFAECHVTGGFEQLDQIYFRRYPFVMVRNHFQLCDDAEVTMSPLTRYLSRLLGVFLLVTVVSEWTQPGLLTVVAPAMVDQPGLLWVSGMLTFVAGLAIVLGHNIWGDPAAAVVSLLWWMMTIKGRRAIPRIGPQSRNNLGLAAVEKAPRHRPGFGPRV
jgi:hypothetical protein